MNDTSKSASYSEFVKLNFYQYYQTWDISSAKYTGSLRWKLSSDSIQI